MKIATRIISGYALLIAVLAGLVVYQILTITRLQATSKTLSELNFQNALNCLQALRDLDRVNDYTRRLAVKRGDPDYQKALQESRENFRRSLEALKTRASRSEEQAEVKRLSQQWDSYTLDLRLLQFRLSQGDTTLPPDLEEDLDRLNAMVDSVYHTTLRTMSSKIEESRTTAELAVLVLWCATFAALAISILVSLLIVRSISKPLAHLTEGTRAISDGSTRRAGTRSPSLHGISTR
jgi:methyl-accepting chemotaxis protein